MAMLIQKKGEMIKQRMGWDTCFQTNSDHCSGSKSGVIMFDHRHVQRRDKHWTILLPTNTSETCTTPSTPAGCFCLPTRCTHRTLNIYVCIHTLYIYIPIGSMYGIYSNMDPINIPPMLAYIPWILWVYNTCLVWILHTKHSTLISISPHDVPWAIRIGGSRLFRRRAVWPVWKTGFYWLMYVDITYWLLLEIL